MNPFQSPQLYHEHISQPEAVNFRPLAAHLPEFRLLTGQQVFSLCDCIRPLVPDKDFSDKVFTEFAPQQGRQIRADYRRNGAAGSEHHRLL